MSKAEEIEIRLDALRQAVVRIPGRPPSISAERFLIELAEDLELELRLVRQREAKQTASVVVSAQR